MIDVADDAQHRYGGLLSRLHQKALPIAGAMKCELANRSDGLFVKSVARIFRYEAAMGLNFVDAEQFCEIRCLLQCIDTCGAIRSRHYTNSGRPFKEVPFERLGAYDFYGGGDDLMLVQGIAHSRGK